MKILLTEGDQPQHKLAFFTERNKASLTRILNILGRKQFIVIKTSTEDLRSKDVSLTSLGQKTITATFPVMREIMSELHEGISQQEIDTTIAVMQKIQYRILKDHPSKSFKN